VISTSDSDEHIFPISLWHWIETSKRGLVDARQEMYELMFDVSKFNTISPWAQILEYEVRNAVLKTFNVEEIDLSSIVFLQGFEGITGAIASIVSDDGSDKELPKDIVEKIKKGLHNPKLMAEVIAKSSAEEPQNEAVDEFDALAERIEDTRRTYHGQKDKKFRRDVADVRFFIEIISRHLIKILEERNIDQKWYMENILVSKEKIIDFMKSVPTGYVFHLLNYYNNTDFSRPITTNDLFDIWAISIAIPYCDMVVIERKWAKILMENNIDELYSTSISYSIEDLSEI